MTLDLSTLTFTPKPYKLLNEFASTGLTQVPTSDDFEPTNTAYTLIGSVQWSTTYSDNRIGYTGNLNQVVEGGSSIEISYGTGNEKVVLLTDTAGTAGDVDVYDGWIIVDNAAIAAGTWNIVITDSDSNVLLTQTVDASNLALEPNPVTLPYLDFANSVTYNGNTYSLSDFISTAGTITRNPVSTGDYSQGITVSNTTFKRVSLDGGTTYGYYFPYTSVSGITFEDSSNYRDIIGAQINRYASIDNLNTGSTSTIPATGLVKLNDAWADTIVGTIGIKIRTGEITTSSKTKGIYFVNCTFENKGVDPRDNVELQYSGFTYNNVTYQASDFVTGGTITRTPGYNNITITGATFKWNPIQGETTNAYYLPLKQIADTFVYKTVNTGTTSIKNGALFKNPSTKSNQTYGDSLITGSTSQPAVYKLKNIGSNMNLKYSMWILNSSTSADECQVNLVDCIFEAAPIATITGDYLSLSNTTQITDSFGNTFNASDVIESAAIDSTTAGTSADPWTVNIVLKGYVPTGKTKTNYCMGIEFVKALSTTNYNKLLENNTTKGNAGLSTMEIVASTWNVSGTNTYAIPQTLNWNLKSTKTDPTIAYSCYVTYYSDSTSYQNLTRYIRFTISVAT